MAPNYGIRVLNIQSMGADPLLADNFAIFQRALSFSNVLVVPPGVYNLQVPPGETFGVPPTGAAFGVLPAGFIIQGYGAANSVINFNCQGTQFTTLMSFVNSGILFQDVTINMKLPVGSLGGVTFLCAGGSDVKFVRCKLSSNTTVIGGAYSFASYLVSVAANADDYTFDSCEITGYTLPILKTGTSIASNNRWAFRGCYVHDNICGISLNNPKGVWDGVEILGGSYGNILHTTAGIGVNGLLQFASVTNVRVEGVYFYGPTDEAAIHIEEACVGMTVTGNTFLITSPNTSWGNGLQILNNNQGGQLSSPTDLIISSNVIQGYGTNASTGIEFVQRNATPAAVRALVVGNVIDGFTTPIAQGNTTPTLSANVTN